MKPVSTISHRPAMLHGAHPTKRLSATTGMGNRSDHTGSPLANFERLVRPGLSFTVISHRRIARADVEPSRNEPAACDREQGMFRSMLFYVRLLQHRPYAGAAARIGEDTYRVTLTHHRDDRLVMQLWTTGSEIYDAAFCDFSYDESALHIRNTVTRENLRQRGLNAFLQRMSYLCAGRPPHIMIHEILHTNPAWNDLAQAYLNSDMPRLFRETGAAASIERRFDVCVTGMRLYFSDHIGLRCTRNFDLAVDPESAFTLESAVTANNRP